MNITGGHIDRVELAARNRMLSAFRARERLRTRLRRRLLHLFAHLPVPPGAAHPGTILLIRPDHVGDLLFTTPAIRALAHARPDAEITALVGPWSAEVLAPFIEAEGEGDHITRVLTLSFPGFARAEPKPNAVAPYRLAFAAARRLRQLGVEFAVIMRPDHWWGALLAYLAGIPNRIGYNLPDVAPFITDALPFAPTTHSVRLNLDLVARWSGAVEDDEAMLAYPLRGEDVAYIDGYLADQGCSPSARVVVIHAGSGSAFKNWLPARWAAAADALHARLSARIVLTGTAEEAWTVREIARGMTTEEPIIAVGDTSLGQLAALCARAALVLGPDSGPLHLAVSVGTPTVHLYGPADPAVYGPWGPDGRHVVLQSTLGCIPCGILDWSRDGPAFHPCIHEISVAQVLAAASAALTSG